MQKYIVRLEESCKIIVMANSKKDAISKIDSSFRDDYVSEITGDYEVSKF